MIQNCISEELEIVKYSKYSINAGFIASLLTFILSSKNWK